MSPHTPTSKRPGEIFLEPTRNVGRKKNLGSPAWIGGHLVVSLGYTNDGLTAAYATPEQVAAMKRAANRAMKSPLVRLLQRLIDHYEKKK